ncbi:hypothetical protein [Saccharopolyspora sp. NPDC002376]
MVVDQPRVRPVLTLQQQRDQAILDEAAARRARGDDVRALRGVTDRQLRIYTKSEAGLAWSRTSSSRAVFSPGGILLLFGMLTALLGLFIGMAVNAEAGEGALFVFPLILVGALWSWCLILVIRAAVAARQRRARGLPAPMANSDHL